MASEAKPELAILNQPKLEEPRQMVGRVANLNPRNFTEAYQQARLISKSEICPVNFQGKPHNILIAMQMGAELGLSPMSAIQNIAVINGRPSLWGDSALAVCQAHPKYEWHKEWLEGIGDARVAVCQVKRQGAPVHERRFSVADAKTARLWEKRGSKGQDTPWITYPERMLSMRARGLALRDQFADSLRGMILAEEALDIPVNQAKTIEHGVLDVSREVELLAESAEPNRGHGNEGFSVDIEKQEKPTQTVLPAPTSAPGPAAEENLDSEPGDATEPMETQESGFHRGVVHVTAAEMRTKRQGKTEVPYVLLTLGSGNPIQVWHQSLHEFALKMVGREADIEVKPSSSQGKIWWSLEIIHRVEDCKFVNNQPVGAVETKPLLSPTGLFPDTQHRDNG